MENEIKVMYISLWRAGKQIPQYALKTESFMSKIFICNSLQISSQKLSGVARKYNGKCRSRYKGGDIYVIFDKKEDAQKCADELNAIIVSKKLTEGIINGK